MKELLSNLENIADDYFEKGYHWYIIIGLVILFLYVMFKVIF